MPPSDPPSPPPTPLTPREGAEVLAAVRRAVPFLQLRDNDGDLVLRTLAGSGSMTLGREGDVRVGWDDKVSRVHAELVPLGPEWTIVDDGLSRNGTFVNGERITRRRRLRDGDSVRVGDTVLVFRAPDVGEDQTQVDRSGEKLAASVTPAQRGVLQALCRPVDPVRDVPPATNEEIAEALFLSVDAVKAHLRQLYARFDLVELPPHQKRTRLAREALRRGLVRAGGED